MSLLDDIQESVAEDVWPTLIEMGVTKVVTYYPPPADGDLVIEDGAHEKTAGPASPMNVLWEERQTRGPREGEVSKQALAGVLVSECLTVLAVGGILEKGGLAWEVVAMGDGDIVRELELIA